MRPEDTVTVQCFWDEGADTSLGLPRYETAGAAGAAGGLRDDQTYDISK